MRHDVFKTETVLCGATVGDTNGVFVSLVSGEAFSLYDVEIIERLSRKSDIPSAFFLQIRDEIKGLKEEEPDAPLNEDSRWKMERRYCLFRGKTCLIDLSSVFGDDITKWEEACLEHELKDEISASRYIIDSPDAAVTREATRIAAASTFTDAGNDTESLKLSFVEQCEGAKADGFSPNEWKCYRCGRSTGLWLNIADGRIGCGRYQWGLDDSGCLPIEGSDRSWREGASVDWHADHLGSEPSRSVVVKLGTLETSKQSDCTILVTGEAFHYDFQVAVDIEDLGLYLSNLGIEIETLHKREFNTSELEIVQSRKFDWSDAKSGIGESKTEPLGRGKVGLTNLGNTCYMSAVLQVIASLIDTEAKVVSNRLIESFLEEWVKSKYEETFSLNEVAQIVRLFRVLVGTDDSLYQRELQLNERKELFIAEGYSKIIKSCPAFSPAQFRNALCGSHPLFSTDEQQDASEFMLYFLTRKTVAELLPFDPQMQMTQTMRCENGETGDWATTKIKETMLSLPIPENHDQLSLVQVLTEYLCPLGWPVQGYKTGVGNVSRARMLYRWSALPDVLILALNRYTVNYNTGEIKKNAKQLRIPENIRLSGCVGDVNNVNVNQRELKELSNILGDHIDVTRIMGAMAEGCCGAEDVSACEDPLGFLTGDEYSLKGAVRHTGESYNSGHYVAYIKKDDGWKAFNDSRVLHIDNTTAERHIGEAYIIIYQRNATS